MEYFTRVQQIASRAAFVCFTLAALAALSGRWPEAFGVMIGFLASLLNFRLLSRSLLKQLSQPPAAARRGTTKACLFRHTLVIAVAFLANSNPHLSVWAVFVGLVLIKVVIYAQALFSFSKQNLLGFLHSVRYERGDK